MKRLIVEFAEHVPPRDVETMLTVLANQGTVLPGANPRARIVEVTRLAKQTQAERFLAGWEMYGWVRWSAYDNSK
jgi:hypothetical protein